MPSVAASSPGEPAARAQPAHVVGVGPPVYAGVPMTLSEPIALSASANRFEVKVQPVQPLPPTVLIQLKPSKMLSRPFAFDDAGSPSLLSNAALASSSVLWRNTGLAALPNWILYSYSLALPSNTLSTTVTPFEPSGAMMKVSQLRNRLRRIAM